MLLMLGAFHHRKRPLNPEEEERLLKLDHGRAIPTFPDAPTSYLFLALIEERSFAQKVTHLLPL